MDLSIAGDVYLYNEGGCGLRKKRYWGVITEPSKVVLQIVNRVARNTLRKKTQINCQGFENNQA